MHQPNTFQLSYQPVDGFPIPVPVTTQGVIWKVDKDRKFKNPAIPQGRNLFDAFKEIAKPPNWKKSPCEMGGFENVDFIVWMRTAALPYFQKLWRIVQRSSNAAFSYG